MRSPRNKLQSIDTWIDNFRSMLASVTSWLPTTLAVGICLGLSTWFLFQPEIIGHIADDQAGNEERYKLLAWTAICVFAVIFFYAVMYRRSRRKSDINLHEFTRKMNRFAVIICIVPIFLFLRTDHLGKEHPFISIIASLGIGLIGAYFAYQIAKVRQWSFFKAGLHHLPLPLSQGKAGMGSERGRSRWIPLIVVILLALSYMAALTHLQTIHHHNLGTRNWDFGLYINCLWHSLRGNFLGCSFIPEGTHITRHFDPILVLISPILLIYNKAETLIVFQAAWVASGAIPLYLLAKHKLGNPLFGIALSLVYLFHPAVHGPNMYDFHSIVLAFPVLLWCMYCLETERIKTYYGFLALLFLIREDTPALAAMMALYMIISGRLYRVAAITIVLATVYGLLVNLVVMANAYSYTYYFREIKLQGHSPTSSIFISLLTNPGFVIKYALGEERILYILKMFMPLMMLPLFSKKHYILFTWGLATTFFGSWVGFIRLGTQYSVYWLPFMLASVPFAIDNISKGRLVRALDIDPRRIRPALAMGMVLCAISMSSLYGVFWPNSSFRPGYVGFQRITTPEHAARYETIKKIQSMIPDDASVLATRRVGAHFSLRKDVWSFHRHQEEGQVPDWVIIWNTDLKRKKDKKIQIPRVKYYKKSDDYDMVLNENGIKVHKRKPGRSP